MAAEDDAKRMGTRVFGGYLADRALNRADFKKKGEMTRDEKLAKQERDAVGYKAGGMVRRGYGRARGA